jgi:RimJ/RimL family protein N-acetyltransferase
MRELGGARPRDELRTVHGRRVAANVGDDGWWLKVVPGPGDEPAGTIGIWQSDFEGAEVYEVGWMLLPPFQGRGIASAALGMLLDRARSDDRFDAIHAFPGVTNGPSNGLCRKFGFELLGAAEVKFRDSPLTVNHWVLTLAAPS